MQQRANSIFRRGLGAVGLGVSVYQFIEAAARGDDEVVQRYIDQQPVTTRALMVSLPGVPPDLRKKTTMHVSEYDRHIFNNSALALAALYGRQNTVAILLNAGADVNTQCYSGETILTILASYSIWRISSIKEFNPSIKVPLQTIFEMLFYNGADINQKNRNGYTPLIQAIMNHHSDMVRVLFDSHPSPDINATDAEEKTALFYAYKEELIHDLIERGGDIHKKDNNGATALFIKPNEYNADKKSWALLQSGADANARTPDGETPLSFAISQGFYEDPEMREMQVSLVRGLLEYKIDINEEQKRILSEMNLIKLTESEAKKARDFEMVTNYEGPLDLEIPDKFICPISQQIMQHPVVVESKEIQAQAIHGFEREVIKMALSIRPIYPLTNQVLDEYTLRADTTLQSEITVFIAEKATEIEKYNAEISNNNIPNTDASQSEAIIHLPQENNPKSKSDIAKLRSEYYARLFANTPSNPEPTLPASTPNQENLNEEKETHRHNKNG